ncbi:hypothetical protein [Chryseobacterium sp.]|uniref:hypothetical protein n=1 Tax=Chryseobacterium sp. TaxID=1871047 RepID=UPI0023532EA9|nr:hypothetical protein [Chryseobacterium sp.]
MILKRELIDTPHTVVVSEDHEAKEKLMNIWEELDFKYKTLSNTELFLFQSKS